MLISPESLVTFIRAELRKVSGPKKENARYINIRCCFHPDNTPSLGVRIAQPTQHAPLGSFRCLGCNKTGRWNELADRLHLSKIDKNTVLFEKTATVDLKAFDRLVKVNTLTTIETVWKKQRVVSGERWPRDKTWRGFHGDFLRKLGAYRVKARNPGELKPRTMLWFPVEVDDELVGGIKALLKPERDAEGNKKPSYLNMSGDWSRSHGLFPYNFVQAMLKKRKLRFVILVEGPRDALKLISEGLPALCVLGTTSLSEHKATLVAGLPIDICWVMGDGDVAGHAMNKLFKKMLRKFVKTKVIRIPITEDAYDPCSLPDSLMTSLKRLVKND